MGIEKAAYKPLRSAPRMSIMISAIGVSYFLQNFATYLFSALPQAYPAIPLLKRPITIGALHSSLVTFLTPILTLVIVILLMLLLKKTKIGMAMRAVAKDYDTSKLMGIKIDCIITITLDRFFSCGSLFHPVFH